MRHILFIFLLSFILHATVNAQVYGCMDPSSSNYNSLATLSDGSCVYPDVSVGLSRLKKATLPETLKEISGMIFIAGKLYGHNDSGGDPAIYEIDTTTGMITKKIWLQGATNVDWEDMTQDDAFVYMGDFGNTNGNRQNLRFYRFPKTDIGKISGDSGTIPASDVVEINFRYEDQTDFTPIPDNSTRYDCEAVIYDNGQLHLFTKNWVSNYTVHYVMPATPLPGVQVAIRKDSLNTGGILITGAVRVTNQTTILLGYEVTGYPSGFLWVISGYSNMTDLFLTGSKRKVGLGKVVDVIKGGGIGQVEGLAVTGGNRMFISNEFFSRTVAGITFTVPQGLYALSLQPQYIVLPIGITSLATELSRNNVLVSWSYNGPAIGHFEVETSNDGEHFLVTGTVNNNNIPGNKYSFIDVHPSLSTQNYYRVKVVLTNGDYSYSKSVAVTYRQDQPFNLITSPAPFNDQLNLSFHCDKDQEIQVRMVDMYGRILFSSKINCFKGANHCQLLSLGSLSKSVYFVTAKTTDALYTKKLVKY